MHKILQRFHRYALSRVMWPLSIIVGLLIAISWLLFPDSLWSRILSPLTSAAAVGAAFLFIERKIRCELWKIAYPELDFSGTWHGMTRYDSREVADAANEEPFVPFQKCHDICFSQDCLNVAVDYDETKDYAGWNSTVATLVIEKNTVGLRYAYEVRYLKDEESDERLPRQSRGLEQVFSGVPEVVEIV